MLRLLLYVATVLLLPSTVFAGQLHITDVLLSQANYAVLAQVLAIRKGKSGLTVLVKKRWKTPGAKQPAGFEVGKSYPVTLYGGVQWDDPHVSPIDFRYWNSKPIQSVREKEDVILLHNSEVNGLELLEANAQNLRKLDIFFSENGLLKYRDATARDTLVKDLADKDLTDIAFDELWKRKQLDASAILSLDEKAPFQTILDRYWKALGSADGRAGFIRDLAELIKSNGLGPTAVAIIKRSAGFYGFGQHMETLPLVRLLDPSKKEQLDVIIEYKWRLRDHFKERLSAQEAEALTPFMLTYAKHRPRHEDFDETIPRFAAALPGSARAAFLGGLIPLIKTSDTAASESDRVDSFLVQTVIDSIKNAEDSALAKVLFALDPLAEKGRESYTFGEILKVGMMLAAKNRAILPMLKKFAGPFLKDPDLYVDHALRARYESIVKGKTMKTE